jgi:hypothetical protein
VAKLRVGGGLGKRLIDETYANGQEIQIGKQSIALSNLAR